MKITATPRDISGKQVKQFRTQDLVPAVMYGPKFESTNVNVAVADMRELYRTVGYSNMFDIEVDGKKSEKALLKEIQIHPTKDEFIHVSFYVIDPESKISADIPLVFEGVSPAEDQGIGFVVTPLTEITVRCLPKDLPSELKVDLTSLVDSGDTISVGDIQLPEGVELGSAMDETSAVAAIATAQKMEEIEEGAEGGEGEADGTEETQQEGSEAEEAQ